MKKYFVGLIAVVSAVVCFSFTSNKSVGACDQSVFWFKITDGSALTSCDDVTAITQFNALYDADGQFDASASDDIAAKTPATNPFGCPVTNQTYVCALGYTQAQLHTVLVGTTYKWAPIDPQDYNCCLKRVTQ